MKKTSKWVSYCVAIVLGAAAAAQEVPVVLQVEVENQVRYGGVAEPSQIARSPVPVPSSIQQLNFGRPILIGDVTAVNGGPAKGAWVTLENNVRLNPNPMVGAAISDATQPAVSIHSLEFLKLNGEPIGTILGIGGVGGQKGWAIVGGVGAFVGARGTISATANPGVRTTSQAEDPSMRRANGGGRGTYVIQLFPMFRPEVLIGPNGPAVFHSDYSPVTAGSPARAGETLIVYVKGLGPTSPSVNPGDPFPSEPFAVATSPVEVLVNGKASPAINQIGVPGTWDTFRVDFRVPEDIPAGSSQLQISAAWVKGAGVSVPVR